MLNAFRLFGGTVLLITAVILFGGWASGHSSGEIPKDKRNSPGAYRSYFILYGGK